MSNLPADQIALDGWLRRTADNARLVASTWNDGSKKNDLMAFAQETDMAAEMAAELLRGEFVCRSCGLRKNAEQRGYSNEF